MQPVEQRHDEHLVAHGGRQRVAGHGDHGHARVAPAGPALRLAGLHPDVPEAGPARLEHDPGHVRVADAHPARDDDDVTPARQLVERRGEGLGGVAHGGRHDRDAPVAGHRRGQEGAVGLVDLAPAQLGARCHQLVAGRDHADHRTPHAHQPRRPGRRGSGQLAWAEPDAGLQDHVARAHVLARPAHVAPDVDDLVDADPALHGRRLLDRHDRVGARGQGGAGHDPHAGAAAEHRVLGRAGQHLAGHVQRHARHEVGGPHGVAVHGRVGEGGHVGAGDECELVFGQLAGAVSFERLEVLERLGEPFVRCGGIRGGFLDERAVLLLGKGAPCTLAE